MQDMWEGCEAAIKALKVDGLLSKTYSVKEASDLLWALLSVRNWEQLCRDRKWTQSQYIEAMLSMSKTLFVRDDISEA